MRAAAPEWVFRWSRLKSSPLPKWSALLLVGATFAFLLTSVRIRVSPPTPWALRKASVIHTTGDAVSRMLTLRAREGGPFPARFEPSEWDGAAAMERAAFEAARWSPPPHRPALKELPDEEPASAIPLAAKGERVFPKRTPSPEPAPAAAALTPAVTLYPLSGIAEAEIPANLPPFEGVVDENMTAERWRFLVRLHPSGSVMDCVSLAGDDATSARAAELENWLRRIRFHPEPGKPARWIAVGIGFTNRPAHGTESR